MSAASVPECPACRPVDDHPQAALQCTRDEGCILKEALAAAPVAAFSDGHVGTLFEAERARRLRVESAAQSAFLLLDNWLHTGNLPDREYAYAVRDGLGVALRENEEAKANG